MNELVMTKCEKVVECDFLFSREKIGGCAHYRGQIFKPFPSPIAEIYLFLIMIFKLFAPVKYCGPIINIDSKVKKLIHFI